MILLTPSVTEVIERNRVVMRYGLLALVLALLAVSLADAAEIDVTKLKGVDTSGKREFIRGGGKEAELFPYEGRDCRTHMWFGGDWLG